MPSEKNNILEFNQKSEVKLESLTNTHMLLMVEKDIRGGMWHAIHGYVKANNKYMKDYNDYIFTY